MRKNSRVWRKQQEYLESEHKSESVSESLTKDTEVQPIPDGLINAMSAKTALLNDLAGEDHINAKVSVSVDLLDGNEWVLTVRGVEPSIRYYGGYKVFYRRAHHTWAPTKRI
ncbi:MAG: hypothetical protein HYS80_00915 [Candidatus Aenigmarchaeota archaeon]|nr:hypothetical protein [Candidatus Aenigmarchaeota archaeon]